MKRVVPRLHLIGPLVVPLDDYPEIATRAARGGCSAIHLRMPGAPAGEVLALARTLRSVIHDATLILNDRLDIALLANADGAQLGEHSFAVSDARRLLGSRILIGRSIHDLEGARRAAGEGADYLLAGHVFETPSKEGTPGRGLDWLARICSNVSVPVIALGGITVERISLVRDAGAYGVAMGREILLADDPEEVARNVMNAMRDVRNSDFRIPSRGAPPASTQRSVRPHRVPHPEAHITHQQGGHHASDSNDNHHPAVKR